MPGTCHADVRWWCAVTNNPYPHDSSGDADYWNLTNAQRHHHHNRLYNYRWRMIEHHADTTGHLWRTALTYATLILGLAGGVTLIAVTALYWGLR